MINTKKVYGNGTCTLLYNVCRNISLYQEIQIISMLNIKKGGICNVNLSIIHFVLKGDLQTSNKKVKQFINNLSAFMQMLIHKFLVSFL